MTLFWCLFVNFEHVYFTSFSSVYVVVFEQLIYFNPSRPNPGQREKKLSQIFIFTLFCGASKGFMKDLRDFIKPFEVPQSVKRKM